MNSHQLDTERESARLAELARLHDFDAVSDPHFDFAVQAVAAIFDVPAALISLIDRDRQRICAVTGMSLHDTPRDFALCNYAIMEPDRVLYVPDAAADPRFAVSPLVTGEPGIRFYAGAPLVSSRGHALGALCVIDRLPRTFTDDQSRTLQALASLLMRVIEGEADRSSAAALRAADQPARASGIAVFGWDRDVRVARWNRAAEALLGWTAADVLGKPPPFMRDTDLRRLGEDSVEILDGSRDAVALCTLLTKDGGYLHAAVRATRDVDAGGQVGGVSTIEVIGTRRNAGGRIELLDSVILNCADAVIVLAGPASGGPPNRILYVNDAFTRMTGYSAPAVIGKSIAMLAGAATDAAVLQRVFNALKRHETVSAELVNYRLDGSDFWVDCSISPVKDVAGRCIYFVAVQRETTTRRALETYEQNRRHVLEMAVRNEPLDTQLARIVMLLKSVIPGSLGTVVLLRGDALSVAAADPQLSRAYLATIDGAQIGPDVGSCGTAVYRGEPVLCSDIATDVRWRAHRDNALRAGLRACWSIPIFAADGAAVGAFALYADRTGMLTAHQLQLFEETVRFAALVVDRHRDRQRLERMALYDGLTGLPNRKLIEDVLQAALTRARAADRVVAVGVLDIDRFKAINDAFGHHVGDELLRGIADRLAGSIGTGDACGRMAGDEFIVVFPDLADTADGVEAATHIIDEFGAAFAVEGYEIVVRPSLGLAFYPKTSTEMAGLLQAADKAMYAAKSRGGGIEIATTPASGASLKRLDLEKDLRFAVERNQLELHYQMIFDLRNGRAIGAEALLRWNHPQSGLIEPGDFIPLAEANGTIVPIGTWVIGEAARVARDWQAAGHDAFVTVNVSARQFDAPGLVATVIEALERYGVEPRRFHLELTESLVMRNPSVSAATLLQLKALGVQIVIDDFGTGYSSLAYLQRFTFDALKIDRAFVRGVGTDAHSERSEHIVAAVVQLGAALGVTTIAEGVENAAQFAFVQSCGCTAVQGFRCARPVPETQLQWASIAELNLR